MKTRLYNLYDTTRAGAAAIIGGFLVIFLGVVQLFCPGVIK